MASRGYTQHASPIATAVRTLAPRPHLGELSVPLTRTGFRGRARKRERRRARTRGMAGQVRPAPRPPRPLRSARCPTAHLVRRALHSMPERRENTSRFPPRQHATFGRPVQSKPCRSPSIKYHYGRTIVTDRGHQQHLTCPTRLFSARLKR
ncbi:unnamed protein product, partial [Iphiclides podalirius]